MKLNELTITEAREGLKNKKFSSVELTTACLERIKRVEPKINAFVTVCEEDALRQAQGADAHIDQSKEKPAIFPLKRLIKGWQIGVPLLKVGGKIKLVVPSDLAYSIRTRSAKIPPNSILEFEIEVLDAKPPH